MQAPAGESPLEKLPLDVLEPICKILALCDPARKSLFAFSLVSKKCCVVSQSSRFSRIYFRVTTAAKLREDVELWDQFLQVHDRFRHVRFVKVSGLMHLKSETAKRSRYRDRLGFDGLRRRPSRSYYDPCQPTGRERDVFLENSRTPEERPNYDEAWLPLANFLAKLPGLKDLVHACADQISPTVLSAAHKRGPALRLHMHTFLLRNLVRDIGDDRPIDPHDLAIATSPCLYSVVSVSPHTLTTAVDHNAYVIAQMATGLARNLTRVNMRRGGPQPLSDAQGRSLERLFSYPYDSVTSHMEPGHLRNLTVSGTTFRLAYSNRVLDTIMNAGTFDNLEKLHLSDAGVEDLQSLADLAARRKLLCLRSLTLYVLDDRDGVTVETIKDVDRVSPDRATSLVLQSLPPLEKILLYGCFD